MDGIKIAPGEKIGYQGRDYAITRMLDLTSILAEDVLTGKPLRIAIRDITPPGGKTSVTYPSKPQILLDDHNWKIAQDRFAIIRPLVESKGDGKKVAEAAKTHGINKATLYRWIERYEATGTVSSLARRYSDGGHGGNRLAPQVDAIIKSAIEEFYLNGQRRSIQRTCLEAINLCRKAGLTTPHPNTIRHRIAHLSGYTRLKSRYGARAAQETYDPHRGPFPDAKAPLEVVEIDHTKLDIILVDELHRKPVGRPWITLATDVFGRTVAGLYLSFDPPGAMGTGLCLAHAILPKEEWLAKLDVSGEWPCWGIMRTIHMDNAQEFKSKMLMRACDEYGIEITYRPAGKPSWGGHIERLIGTITKEIHNLPGTTFSTPQERKDYDSERKAVLTLKELEKWLATYIVDVYHRRVHSALGKSPLSKYEEGVFGSNDHKGTGMPVKPTDKRKIYLDFMPYVERSVQEYGVVIDHIHYYHDVLRRWIHATERPSGSKSKVKRRFIFKRDPRDISVVYFLDPDLKEYYPIPYRDTSRSPISLWEYKAAFRKLREEGKREVDENAIFDAYDRMREIEANAVKQSASAKRASNRKKPEVIPASPVYSPLQETVEETVAPEAYSLEIKPFDDLENDPFKFSY